MGRKFWRLGVLVSIILAVALPTEGRAQPTVSIGVVLDGPWERNEEIRGIFVQEILDLTRGEFQVRFPEEKMILADWTLEGAKQAVDTLLTDPEVDMVLTSGPLASTYAGRLRNPSKPLIAAFVINPAVQGIPFERDASGQGISGVTRLNYITFSGNLTKELRRFRELASFQNITFLVNKGLTDAIPELMSNLRVGADELGVGVEVIQVERSAREALEAIPEDCEAVYVVPLIQLPPGDFDQLVQGLIDRGLPSFSVWGRDDVERGILTSIYQDADFNRLGRRLALNIHRILLGEDAGTLPVEFERSERLTINMATARAIRVYPNWSLITEAELLHNERPGVSRKLTLSVAARQAVAANLDLAASDEAVAAGLQDIKEARSFLFPTIEVSGFSQLARSSPGQPKRVVGGGASLSQLLYSEPVRSNIEIQESLQASRERQREQIRLDIVQQAVVAYLNVLRTKTFERIQRQNLALTRSHLELSRSRRQIGVARASEVIRWENQIANNRRDVIAANAQRNQAEIQLNRLLDRPSEEPFDTEETDLSDPSLITDAQRLEPYLNNPWGFKIFRDFMAGEALLLSPEIHQLDAAIEAQERLALSARRAFWHPTLALQADVRGIAFGGLDSFDVGLPQPLEFPGPNNFDWSVGLNLSLPLFTGGARDAELERALTDLTRLRIERESLRDQIEQRLRSTLHLAGASYAGIQLAKDAADAAQRNLQLVRDAYSKGAVPILDLLDAQNAALVADQLAANAVYDYLIDNMNAQRAVGRFDFFMTPAEQQAFLARLDEFFRQAGYAPRN